MAMGMGGERRTWVRSHAASPRITFNADALQAENFLLRQEVMRLRQQLESRASRAPAAEAWSRRSPVTSGAPSSITPDHVRRWGEAMSRHRRWHQLRVGATAWMSPHPHGRGSAPGYGLKGLIEQRLGAPAETAADFERLLDRRWPGLGGDLASALRGPASKARLAVRAAFALLGPAAAARLDLEPLAVVELLVEAMSELEAAADAAQTQRSWRQPRTAQEPPPDGWNAARRRAPSAGPSAGSSAGSRQRASQGPGQDGREGTPWGSWDAAGSDRSAGNRRRTTGAGRERAETADSGSAGARQEAAGAKREDQGQARSRQGSTQSSNSGSTHSSNQGPSQGSKRSSSTDTPPPSGNAADQRQVAALETLGLAWGASKASIKAAHRRLVKQHHPDMGGDAESFRLVNDAYQLLIA